MVTTTNQHMTTNQHISNLPWKIMPWTHGCLGPLRLLTYESLVAQARLDPPPSIARDRCGNAPVALCFSGYPKLSPIPLSGPPKRSNRSKGALQGRGYRIYLDVFELSGCGGY